MDKNIGRLNVEITADATKLKDEADGAVSKLKQVQTDILSVQRTELSDVAKPFTQGLKDVQSVAATTNKEVSSIGQNVKPIDTNKTVSKLDELRYTFDSVMDAVKAAVYPIGSVISSSFSKGKTGVNDTANSVNALKLDIDSLSPSLQRFAASLKSMTTRTLEKNAATATAELAKLEQEMADIQRQMQQSSYWEVLLALQKQMDAVTPKAQELQTKLALIQQKLDSMNAEGVTRVTNGMNGANASAKGFAKQLDRTITHGVRKLKKLAVSLIGLRTVWSLLTRATRDYLSRDKELATRTQSMIAALGYALAPITSMIVSALEQVVKWLMIAIAYVTSFVNILFGVNIAINSNIKAMKKWADQSKAAKSMLAGFDDLNVLQQPDSNENDLANSFGAFDISKELEGMKQFNEFVTQNKDLLLALIVALGAFIAALIVVNTLMGIMAILSSPVYGIILGIMALIAVIVYLAFHWDEVVKAIVDSTVWLFNTIVTFIKLIIDLIIGALTVLLSPVISYFSAMGEFISGIFNTVFSTIAGVIGGLSKIITSLFAGIISIVLTVISTLIKAFGGIITFFQGVFTLNWKKAWEGIVNIISSIWNGILKLFNIGGNIFGGIVDGISAIFKSIVNGLIGGINTIIAAPLNFINGILNLIRNISVLGLKPFSGLWKENPIPVPKIPKLASGAVATGPVIAQIGEGRYNEAVIPLGQSPQFSSMKTDIANAVAEALGNSSTGPIDITIKVKDETLAKVAIDSINRLQRRAGRTLLEV